MRFVFFAALVAAATLAAAQVPVNCSGGVPNAIPVWSQPPQLVTSVANAKLFTAGTGNDTFSVLHLWGTPYEKGFAQGTLRKAAILQVIKDIIPYIEEQVTQAMPSLPQALVDFIVKYGAPLALQMSYSWTKPFMPQAYIDEMQGIADGAGVPVQDVQNYNMFPELTKAACTIVGANGAATPNALLNQLRALDFDPTMPMKDYAQVTVYHAQSAAEQTFMTVGWAGMIGALTGFSSAGVGIGEKVWLHFPKDAEGVHGKPWMFILRDVLAFTTAMPQALDAIQTANRTCAIHVGVGTASDNQFRGLTIAKNAFDVYTDKTLNYPAHPMLPGLVYWNRHSQPSNDFCLGDLLTQYYGNVTAENLALNIGPMSQTGNLHAVSFDYAGMKTYIANARKTSVQSGDINAYNRQYTLVDMAALFSVQQ